VKLSEKFIKMLRGITCLVYCYPFSSPTTSTILSLSYVRNKYTELFEMIVGVLTTCHTQYT